MDVLELFRLSPSACSTDWSGCSVNIPNKLLAEVYKVFHDVCSANAFVPWPPPSCTHAKSPLINEHDLFHNVLLKHTKEFVAVLGLRMLGGYCWESARRWTYRPEIAGRILLLHRVGKPINFPFGMVHLLFSRSAESNRETSLNLVASCGYLALTVALTRNWMLIIVGHLLQYGLEVDALWLLLFWLRVPYLQLFLIVLSAVTGDISCIPGAFPAILHERAEAQYWLC